MSRIIGAVVGLGLIVTAANAVVIEIPLPGLLGVYPVGGQNAERTVTFVLPQAPAVVHGASIRISGTTGVGTVACEGGSYPWPMDVGAFMSDTAPAHFWIASEPMPEVAGSFAWTAEFHPTPPTTTTWGFLMDGEAEITLYGAPIALVGLCSGVPPGPTATVEEAVLIIDAEFPVSTETSTWGRIKSLYRAR